MQLDTSGIVCAVRNHAEHGGVVRVMTPHHGLLAGYVRGARSRTMRPVLIAGNEADCSFRGRTADQMPSLTLEMTHSRGALMTESLAADAVVWTTSLVTAALAEAHPYPRLFKGLQGVLLAIEAAPAARGWAVALAGFERLVLAELGYGGDGESERTAADWTAILPQLEDNGAAIARHLLADRKTDLFAARIRLIERLKRAVA